MAFEEINVLGRDWLLVEEYLIKEKETAVQVLCSDISPDETNKVRGRIVFIDKMLKKAESIRKNPR